MGFIALGIIFCEENFLQKMFICDKSAGQEINFFRERNPLFPMGIMLPLILQIVVYASKIFSFAESWSYRQLNPARKRKDFLMILKFHLFRYQMK